MNSAIDLCQSPLPITASHLSSARRVHVSLSHGSVSVSQRFKRSNLVSRPLYVKCALDRFSEKEEKGKNNIVRRMGGASLVLACVLGAFTLRGKMNLKPNLAYARDFEYQHTQEQDTLSRMECSVMSTLQQLISIPKGYIKIEPKSSIFALLDIEPDDQAIDGLKFYAMALSKEKNVASKARELLRNECEYQKAKRLSTANRTAMALIELLLYEGKYREASNELDNLLDKVEKEGEMQGGVGREEIYLLKAVAVSVFDAKKAATWWGKYQKATDESPRAVRFRLG